MEDSVARAPERDLISEIDVARLHRLALTLVNGPEAADDLLADAIERTLPRWSSGRVDDPNAYVRRTIVNLAVRRWRRRRLGLERDHRAAEWHAASRDHSEDVAERDATLRAVSRLPPRRRAIVVLRFYDDLPLEEIGTALGIATGTVKSQLSKALGQLRRELGGQEG